MTILKPVDNLRNHLYNGHNIKFTEVHELVQGGPETGNLIIDNFQFDQKLRFGTNILFYKERYAIVPRYKWAWGLFKYGNFKCCIIDLFDKSLIDFGKVEVLIMPKEVIDKKVMYYNDLKNSQLHSTPLPSFMIDR